MRRTVIVLAAATLAATLVQCGARRQVPAGDGGQRTHLAHPHPPRG